MKRLLVVLVLVLTILISNVAPAKAEDIAMFMVQYVEAVTGLAGEKLYLQSHTLQSILPNKLKFSTTLVWPAPQGTEKIQFTDFDAEADCNNLAMKVTGYRQFSADDMYVGENPIDLPEFNQTDLVSTACSLSSKN